MLITEEENQMACNKVFKVVINLNKHISRNTILLLSGR